MKKTFTLLVISIFTITIWAQSPNKLSYQAVVRDADDNLLTEQSVGMKISILQGTEAGTAVYTELQAPTTNANGLLSVAIGSGITSDDFSTIDWASGPYFIKTEIDPEGSTNYTITAVSQLLSVPYAKYAEKAGSAEITGTETAFDGWDKDEDPWTESSGNLIYNGGGNVGIGDENPNRPLVVNSGSSSSYIASRNDASGSELTDGFLVGIDTNNDSYVWNWEDGDLHLGTKNLFRMSVTGDGDVGIGTKTPTAKLDVNGDAKFGSSGVVFSELREITGTTSSTLHYVVVTLPTGYDEDNTRIISLQINYNSDRWSGLGSDNVSSSNASTSYIINGTSLYIYYPDLVPYKDKSFRALIMKIE